MKSESINDTSAVRLIKYETDENNPAVHNRKQTFKFLVTDACYFMNVMYIHILYQDIILLTYYFCYFYSNNLNRLHVFGKLIN